METITTLGMQWSSSDFMLTVWPILNLVLLLFAGYLALRFLWAGIRFFRVLTVYFEQQIDASEEGDDHEQDG